MRMWRPATKTLLLSTALLIAGITFATQADAAPAQSQSQLQVKPRAAVYQLAGGQVYQLRGGKKTPYVTQAMATGRGRLAYGRGRGMARSYGISCVPYARMASGIVVSGNAWQWWDNAAGLYARGSRPEPGGVLSFRANRAMPMGHVAVVSHVIGAREILINHANWPSGGGRGGVSQNVSVVDVSEANDWSAVRVELGHAGEFGSIYPTHGFIYDHPDNGVIEASRHPATPMVALNAPHRDLRPASERGTDAFEEVAEAPRYPRVRRHRTQHAMR